MAGEGIPAGTVMDRASGEPRTVTRDGTREINRPYEIEDEAQALLGLSDEHLWKGSGINRLFSLPPGEAVTRLRELTEEAEAVKVNG